MPETGCEDEIFSKGILRGALVAFSAIFSAVICPARPLNSGPPRTPADSSTVEGKFRLHKFEKAIGEERCTIQQNASGVEVTSSFSHSRIARSKVAPTSKLRATADLPPAFFSIRGDVAGVPGSTHPSRQSTAASLSLSEER